MKAYLRYLGIADHQDSENGSCYFESRCRVTLLPENGDSSVNIEAVKTELEDVLTRTFHEWLQRQGIEVVHIDRSFERITAVVGFGGPMA